MSRFPRRGVLPNVCHHLSIVLILGIVVSAVQELKEQRRLVVNVAKGGAQISGSAVNPLGSARGMMQWGGDSLDLQDWIQIWASTMLNVMTGCAGMPITIIRQPELLADAYSSLKTLEESLTRIGVPGLALPLRRSEGDPTRHLPKAPPRRGARTPEEALGDPHPFSHAELGIIHLMESLPRESHWSIAEMQAKLAPIKYAAAQAAPRTGAWAAGDPSSIHLFAWCPPGPGEGGGSRGGEGAGAAACALSPRQLRCLEALVARHPRRRVVLASNREFDLEQLKGFRKLRYSIWMVTYKQIVGYLPKKLWPFKHIKLGDALKGEPALTWQVLAAFLWGGLALPLGALPLRSLDALPDRTLAYQAPFGSLSVFLKFDEPENEFLGKVLREYFLLKKENNYSSLMDHNLFDLLISRLQEYRGELPITVDSEEIFDQRFTLSNITQCFDANSPPTGIVGGGAFLLDLHDDATRAHALDRDAECQVLLRSSCLFCDEVLEPYTMAAAGAPGPSAGQGGGSQAKRAAAARAARPLAVNRPPLLPPGGPAAFRLAWTTPAATFAPWRRRALAAVFAHHPDAQVNYYSNSLTQDMFSEFTDVGYAARAVPLACGAIFQNTPLEGWYQQVDEWRQGPFFYSHLTDALRLALMWKFGGIYMDADFVVMSNLTALPTMVASQGEPKHDLNGAFMKMPPGHPFLALAMEGYLQRYDPAPCDKTRGGRGPEAWRGCYAQNWNLVGPDLVTEAARRFRELAPSLVTDLTSYSSTPSETVISRHPSALNIFPWQTLYPIPWTDAEKPYFVLPGAASEKEVQQVKSEYKSLAMHLWSNRNKYRGIPPFSFGDLLLKEHSSRILDTLAEDEWLQQMQSKVTVIFTSRSAAPAPGVAIFSSGTSDRRPGLMVLSATAQGTPTVVQCPKERDPEVCLRQLEPADGLDSNVPEGELARAMRAVPSALSATPYIAWVGEGATLPGTRNLEWAVDILENNPDIGVIGAVPFKNGKALNLETYKRISCDKEDKQGQGRQCACTNPLDDSGGLQETLYLGFPMLIGRATVLQKAVVRLTPRTNQHAAEIKDGQFFLLMSTIVGQGDSVYLMPEIRSEYLGAGESAKDFWHDKQLDENLTAIRIRQCSAKQSSKTRSHDIVSLEPE